LIILFGDEFDEKFASAREVKRSQGWQLSLIGRFALFTTRNVYEKWTFAAVAAARMICLFVYFLVCFLVAACCCVSPTHKSQRDF